MKHLDPERTISAWVNRVYADRESPECRRRYFGVTIHPDAAHLRTAAMRYERGVVGGPDSVITDAVGMWQPRPFTSRYDRSRKVWVDTTHACAGMMRLARGWLNAEIIAHESTHAALHIWRLWYHQRDLADIPLPDHDDANEEAFAYLVGGVTAAVTGIVDDYQTRTGCQ